MRILTLLMRLRQICCHPTLFDENYDKDSGKLDLLMELVTNAVESGHRILVFSQFTSMLSIIRESLKNVGIDSFYLDGKTPSYEDVYKRQGLRGAASIVFAIMAMVGGVTMEQDVFHIAFCVVLFSITLQGSLLPFVASKTNMIDKTGSVLKTFNDYSDETEINFIRLNIDSGNRWIDCAAVSYTHLT